MYFTQLLILQSEVVKRLSQLCSQIIPLLPPEVSLLLMFLVFLLITI